MSSKKKVPLNVVGGDEPKVPPDMSRDPDPECEEACAVHCHDEDDCCDEDGDCEPCCDIPCVGCLVVLRSGGPAMTVTAVTCCDRVQVEWFCEGGELHHAEWPADALVVVDCAA